MTNILEGEQSIYQSGTTDISGVLRTIAKRYMADHPKRSLGMYPQLDNGIIQSEDAMFDLDFGKMYPDAKDGAYCYAMSYFELKEDEDFAVHIDAKYWSELYINGELIAKTSVSSEAMPKKEMIIYSFKKGKNVIFIKARKNILGFKAVFGEGLVSDRPMHFRAPFAENEGFFGWLYTTPFDEDIYKNPVDFPSVDDAQPGFWVSAHKEVDSFEVLGNETGYVYACSNLCHPSLAGDVTFRYNSNEACTVYVDGNQVHSGMGKNEFSVILPTGFHYVVAEICHEADKEFGFKIEAFSGDTPEEFQPFKSVRTNHPWLYMGVLSEKNEALIKAFDITLLGKTSTGYTYYRAGFTNEFMRPVREDKVYGVWSYPLGVVMYGLLEASKELKAEYISDYAIDHILVSTKIHEYAKWDKETYNVASLNGSVVSLDMLDYCGSFGNAILYASEFTDNNKTMINLAHYISDYIKNRQERLPNGMFYRECPGTIHNNTIWADDLYMSVPFLCRYYNFTGNEEFLDDAVNQFLCFKEYLYMPDKKLMSHVYNLNYGTNTRMPWGRGNGWTLFSFTELLRVLPENHPKRDELLSFFIELCEGVLSNQDGKGMWHQLVNDHDSYTETSCTAMFTCAFARGVKNGWLDKKFADAAIKGWNGLCNYAIDSEGNVYGVCVASCYSFRTDYYKEELLWHTNDLHGIGIVMLAGVEVNRLINNFL